MKGKCNRAVARPSLLYGPECWAVRKGQEQRMQVSEMRIPRYMIRVLSEAPSALRLQSLFVTVTGDLLKRSDQVVSAYYKQMM